MTKHVLYPKLEIYLTKTPVTNVYTLLINDEYAATFPSEKELKEHINLITDNVINDLVNEGR